MNTNSFSYKIYKKLIPFNIRSMSVLYIFTVFFGHLNLSQTIISLGIAFIIFSIFEFIVDPVTNSLKFKRLDELMLKWEKGKITTDEERTILLEALMKLPQQRAILSLCNCIGGCMILSSFYFFIPAIHLSPVVNTITYFSMLYGAYNNCLFMHTLSEITCTEYAEKIFSEGVSKKMVMKKKHFGLTSLQRCIRFLILPIVNSNLLILFYSYLEYAVADYNSCPPKIHILKMIILTVTCLSIYLYLGVIYCRYLYESNKKMTKTITDILTKGEANTLNKSNLCDELQYNIYLINNTVQKFQELIKKANEIGNGILSNTKELSTIAQDFSTTSSEQNELIQGIAITAEKSKEVSLDLQNSMIDVYIGVEQTNEEVEHSLITLNESINQMEMIKSVNIQNTQDIIVLSKLIDNIDEILVMIKDIADQTRIIAFNAELEAISAKEEGKNFHIVASEIRRLAKNTMNSIREIEGYIVNLQNASLSLIAASENETSYINDQGTITEQLKKHFLYIKDSAEETNNKALEIKDIITQQTTSFEQIAQTLMQIGEGFNNFTSSTKTISDTAHEIESAASILSSLRDVRKEF